MLNDGTGRSAMSPLLFRRRATRATINSIICLCVNSGRSECSLNSGPYRFARGAACSANGGFDPSRCFGHAIVDGARKCRCAFRTSPTARSSYASGDDGTGSDLLVFKRIRSRTFVRALIAPRHTVVASGAGFVLHDPYFRLHETW
jgi:hypothetical protein